jgi:hypothetical protein
MHDLPSAAREVTLDPGDDVDGPKYVLLRHLHLALPGQFQPGDERAGPGRTPPQGPTGLIAGRFGRLRQELFKLTAVRHSGETPQDPLACLGPVMEIQRPRAV